MAVISTAFGALLLAWWVISLIVQLTHGKELRRISFLDRLSLIPRWHFFAPNPGTEDYHILFCDRLSDATQTPVQELQLVHPRRWYHAIWHPEKKAVKALTDIVQQLSGLANERLENQILSRPYLMLLNIVLAQSSSLDARARRFFVVSGRGYDSNRTNRILYESPYFSLKTG